MAKIERASEGEWLLFAGNVNMVRSLTLGLKGKERLESHGLFLLLHSMELDESIRPLDDDLALAVF